MPLREVDRPDWAVFCKSYSQAHEGWVATLSVAEGSEADNTVVEELPLVGVSYDEDEDTLYVTIGDLPETHVTHIIEDPTQLAFAEAEDEVNEVVTIVDAEGRRSTLRLRAPVPLDADEAY